MICLHSKKNEGIIFGEVGWFAGCRTTLVPAEKKWKRQTFNSSNCEICFPNIFHQKFLLKGTQESGNSYILQKAKVKASNVKVVRDNKIEVFWFPSFQVAIKFVACVFVFFSFFCNFNIWPSNFQPVQSCEAIQMGRLKVLDNLGPRLVCLIWGPSSFPNTGFVLSQGTRI